MNKLYPGYSQHRDVAPQTRKLHDHLIRNQRIDQGIAIVATLVAILGVVAIIYTWN
jgi:hypothetical protein